MASTNAGTLAGDPATGAGRPLWIRNPRIDLALFVGVPLFLVPLIVAAPGRPDLQQLILYLGAFGALGHHLPGMLRAYGDRELFRRFRARLVLAPLLLVATCVGFSLAGLTGVVLLTFLWTTWHTLMQVYGFARIYDSKVASVARWTSRLDHAVCIAWIGAPLAYSDGRVAYALELWYRCGLPLVSAGLVDLARNAWLVATALVTAAFVAHTIRSWALGARPNPIKLLFFATSFGFWWFCMVAVEHLVAGIALFDVFHDVQYLALVWHVQQSHAARSAGAGAFTRFLFRSSGGLIGLYVGLVVAYGSIGFFSGKVPSETAREVLLGVLAASALFHFYLDGFIWKVREHGTRAGLGIERDGKGPRAVAAGDGIASRGSAGSAPASARVDAPSAASGVTPGRHAAKWTLFVAPLALLAVAESRPARPPEAWQAAIVAAAPRSAEALTNHGVTLAERGDLERAIELHRRAIELKPSAPEPRHNLGVALTLRGELEAARASFEEALRLRPSYARAHAHLAGVLQREGRAADAEAHLREALRHDARYAEPRASLAVLHLARGDAAGAVPLLREALALDPEHRGALNNLAWVLATTSRRELRAPREALELARRFDRLTGHRVPQALDTLAAAQAAAGEFDAAVRTADEAIVAARERASEPLARAIESHRERYRAGQALELP